jgi:hypothetical protein
MKKTLLLSALFLFSFYSKIAAQTNDCNKLGIWLWYLEPASMGYKTHAELAKELVTAGIKRVYVKTADSKPNPSVWPELMDKTVPKAYKDAGLEVWSWSYNYPKNDSLQAHALYLSAQTGYEGHVIDIETEFDKDSLGIYNIAKAFGKAKNAAIAKGYAKADFQLSVTTWGNPKDHNYNIRALDKFVDSYMPQTYVEQWGATYMNKITYWVNAGNAEYKKMGATKPIHHIVSNEDGKITTAQLDEFIAASGKESSLWRVPGTGVPLGRWNQIKAVNWKKNFCSPTATLDGDRNQDFVISPNPCSELFTIRLDEKWQNTAILVQLNDLSGKAIIVQNTDYQYNTSIDVSNIPDGMYICNVRLADGSWVQQKIIAKK